MRTFSSKDEPATNEHHYRITNNNITKKHITYTILTINCIIVRTIDIPMRIITIKNKM